MERINVEALDVVAKRLYIRLLSQGHSISMLSQDALTTIAEAAVSQHQSKFSAKFVAAEWREVVDTWQLLTWEEYRDFKRLGRKTRLPEAQRQALWSVFEMIHEELDGAKLLTLNRVYAALAKHYSEARSPFQKIVVDEAQDLSPMQLRFLAALGNGGGRAASQSLFFAGDLGQRIFQTPFHGKTSGWIYAGARQRSR